MSDLAFAVENCRPVGKRLPLSREAEAELMSGVDVVSRRLSGRRPARWLGAPVDVLSAVPSIPYTRVASLWAPASGLFATAIAYERCPATDQLAALRGDSPPGLQLLIKRARELGADAIVVHAGANQGAAIFGIH